MTQTSQLRSLPPGTRIDGRYEIVSLLGEGGFATVYEAIQLNIRRHVALKILHQTSPNKEKTAIHNARFLREAQAAARIDHPHVVTIHDFGFLSKYDDAPYIVMEKLSGHDLRTALNAHGAMSAPRALKLTHQALQALSVAHALGIVHKDLKPSNLFLTHPGSSRESLRVVDFGIAHVRQRKRLTRDGQLPGTPQYMAPEYLLTQQATSTVDVYQMGLILVEMLTGRPVVDEPRAIKCMVIHTSGQLDIPQTLRDGPLGDVLSQALAFDPVERYPDADAFLNALVNVNPNDVHVDGLAPANDAQRAAEPRAALGMMDTADNLRPPHDGANDRRRAPRKTSVESDRVKQRVADQVIKPALPSDSDDDMLFGLEEEQNDSGFEPHSPDAPSTAAAHSPTPTNADKRATLRQIPSPSQASADVGTDDDANPARDTVPEYERVVFFAPAEQDTVKVSPPRTPHRDPSPRDQRHANERQRRVGVIAAVGLGTLLCGAALLFVVQLMSPQPRAPRQEAPPENYVLIQGGTFVMGSPDDEPGRALVGETQHEVTLTVPFVMQRTEVTQGQWEEIMDDNPSRMDRCGPNCPVEGVGWWDALTFLNKLSARDELTPCYTLRGCEGQPGTTLKCGAAQFKGLECDGYRLPTEAEWEFAARAGHQRARYGALGEIAWCAREGRSAATSPVASKASNALGLYDMLGNVHEWVWDRHAKFTDDSAVDPISIESPVGERVYKGGSFDSEGSACRAAYRGYDVPTYRVFDLGLRPVRSWLK